MSTILRIRLLFVGIIIGYIAVSARLFYWQIKSGDKLSALADAQHFSTFDILARRGEIKAVDGSNLVGNKEAYLLFANLTRIKEDPLKIAKDLSQILISTVPIISSQSSLIAEEKNIALELEKKLRNDKSVWVPLFHKIDDQSKNKIDNLYISGLEFAPEQTRFYPEASMGAHLLGFVGSDENGDNKGFFGLEGYYNRELSGRSGYRRLEKDALGKPIAIGSDIAVLPEDGRTLVTSIDKYVQQVVEDHLVNGIKTWGATGGTVIVMDPFTGRIIAISSIPAYDPVNYTYFDNRSYLDPAISQTFEPGSIFKPLVMAAAINEGKVKPDTTCPVCAGPRSIGGGVIRTFNNQYHPNTTMTEVLQNSDNTGMVFVGDQLGKDKLLEYIHKYQFAQKTGIDLQGEEQSQLKSQNQWYSLDIATLTFGQGIAVTPMQMVRAYATIANGGYLVTPQVVNRIIEGNKTIDIKPKIGPQVISLAASKAVTEIMVTVTEKSPLHFPRDRTPNLSKFKIAAKSGTAQIPIAGEYGKEKIIGSVMGFAPAQNPKFLILVKLDEPSVRQWGSDTAGPVFFNIVNDLLIYYGISP